MPFKSGILMLFPRAYRREVAAAVQQIAQRPSTGSRLVRARRTVRVERLVRIGRGGWDGYRVVVDLPLQIGDRGVKLRVLAGEGGVWQVVHHHVRVDSMPLDEPLPFRSVDA